MSLIIENLSFAYDKQVVLKDINLKINQGDFVSLLGPSGSGKTTLLKCIAGLNNFEKGELVLHDEDLSRIPVHKRNISYVFQDLRLFPHLSVYDNIAFPLKMHRIKKEEWPKRINQLLKEVQMESFSDRNIQELSGGQQQRIALARALAIQPNLLLLDEPFSGLDFRLSEEMGYLLQDIHKKKKLTIIMVTHNTEDAIKYSSHIALLKEGQILQVGQPDTLLNQPKNLYVAQYFGNINVIEGSIKNNIFSSVLGSWPVNGNFKEGHFTAVFRPSDGELSAKDKPAKKTDLCFPVDIQAVNHFSDFIQLSILAKNNGHIWKKKLIKQRNQHRVDWTKESFILSIDPKLIHYFPK